MVSSGRVEEVRCIDVQVVETMTCAAGAAEPHDEPGLVIMITSGIEYWQLGHSPINTRR